MYLPNFAQANQNSTLFSKKARTINLILIKERGDKHFSKDNILVYRQ